MPCHTLLLLVLKQSPLPAARCIGSVQPPCPPFMPHRSASLPVLCCSHCTASLYRLHCTAACRYNFMPLARGSAFCGYVSMLGALLAAGTPVRSMMPQVGGPAGWLHLEGSFLPARSHPQWRVLPIPSTRIAPPPLSASPPWLPVCPACRTTRPTGRQSWRAAQSASSPLSAAGCTRLSLLSWQPLE